MINNINLNQSSYKQSTDIKTLSTLNTQKASIDINADLKQSSSEAAVYQPSADNKQVDLTKYSVDMDKINAMKDETDQRMVDMFRDTVKGTGLKQLGGIRGILDKLDKGEKVSLEIEYTQEDVKQAKIDVAEGGYWSAGKTSDRLVDFAKALSGDNPQKAKQLKDAFVSGFKEIEKMFGGKLPELSYNTYDLTMKKFDEWSNGETSDVPASTEAS